MINKDLRFCIQLSDKHENHIRVAQYLKKLGRKKGIFIVIAVEEYLNNHPENELIVDSKKSELVSILSDLKILLQNSGINEDSIDETLLKLLDKTKSNNSPISKIESTINKEQKQKQEEKLIDSNTKYIKDNKINKNSETETTTIVNENKNDLNYEDIDLNSNDDNSDILDALDMFF